MRNVISLDRVNLMHCAGNRGAQVKPTAAKRRQGHPIRRRAKGGRPFSPPTDGGRPLRALDRRLHLPNQVPFVSFVCFAGKTSIKLNLTNLKGYRGAKPCRIVVSRRDVSAGHTMVSATLTRNPPSLKRSTNYDNRNAAASALERRT